MTKGDKITAVIIILISLTLFIGINATQINSGKNYASIQIDGKEVEKITLGQSSKKQYTYETEYGLNIIEVDNEKVHMHEADCDDQICVRQGYIENSGEMIVCLPNRFVVEIKNDKGNEFDAINY
ncbi:NusG domain II-containing protein [Gallicola sp. Sow4_E12]|uniref:NusG domain II-containing protein n=1 Tax=Gallicola sp. Sow4_E12 TaxID=3438785 RepID=UPI003F8E9FEA